MSWAALAWATKQNTGKSTSKIVLLAYADRHNEETGCAYPSIAWLCAFTEMNRKTVVTAVAHLEALGLLTETENRAGSTKQIKVYKVNVGTVPKTEQFQKRNSTEKSVKQYRKRDTEPFLEPIPFVISNDMTFPANDVQVEESDESLKPAEVVEAWNIVAKRKGLPLVKKLTRERQRRLGARLKDHTIDEFTEAIKAIDRSPFLHGDNNRGWRADFDFLLQPNSFTKLIEGAYDRAEPKQARFR